MSALDQIRSLLSHAAWADAAVQAALEAHASPPPLAVREYVHIVGAEEVWLSRLEARPAEAPVWPDLSLREVTALARAVRAGYAGYGDRLAESDLDRGVTYTNSAGLTFTTPIGDILLHVALHGQYHRGKVNLLLRASDLAPAPVDFIAYVRGVPAATTTPPPAR